MKVESKVIGSFYGHNVIEYTCINDAQMKLSVLNYGGIVTGVEFPDRNNKNENRVLGYRDWNMYKSNPMYFGGLIGRIAGRIKDGRCTLQGEKLSLEQNEGCNHLHGGTVGLHSIFYSVEFLTGEEKAKLILTAEDKDGKGGYPGNMEIKIVYSLTNRNEWIIEYSGKTDKTTLFNPTNHTYFNLNGDGKGTILDHKLIINSAQAAEIKEATLPTWNFLQGNREPAFDFLDTKLAIRDHIEPYMDNRQIKLASGGIDHAFLLKNGDPENLLADAVLLNEKTGIKVSMTTTEESVVVYTCNKVTPSIELKSGMLEKYSGVTMETQALPDRINSDLPLKVVLQPDKTYYSRTCFAFSNF